MFSFESDFSNLVEKMAFFLGATPEVAADHVKAMHEVGQFNEVTSLGEAFNAMKVYADIAKAEPDFSDGKTSEAPPATPSPEQGVKVSHASGVMFPHGCARFWRRIGGEDVELYITPDTDVSLMLRNLSLVLEMTETAAWIAKKEASRPRQKGDQETVRIDSIVYTMVTHKGKAKKQLQFWREGRDFAEWSLEKPEELQLVAEALGVEALELGMTFAGPFMVTVQIGNPKKADAKYLSDFWKDVIKVERC